ncbi:hypothetical protein ACWD1Z_34785 [Streptomyces sp. NPDC002784]
MRAGGGLRAANEPVARHYQATMGVLRKTLARELPPGEPESAGVHWNDPHGGFFLTLDVPFAADEAALRRSAETYGVTVDQAAEGATQLARFVKDHTQGRVQG